MDAAERAGRAGETASPAERRIAYRSVAVALSLAAASFAVAAAPERLAGLAPLISLATVAMATTVVVSAALLYNQYRATGEPGFALLGTAYGSMAAFLVASACESSGLLPAAGAADRAQTTVWLWVAWHGAFALLALVYLRVRREGTLASLAERRVRVRSVVAAAAVLTGLTLYLVVTQAAGWPALGLGDVETATFRAVVVPWLVVVEVAALLGIARATGGRDSAELWLAAVLVTMLLETVTIGEVASSSYSLAWLLARAIGWYGVTLYLAEQLRRVHELLSAYASRAEVLERAALHDALTGLYNRRGFDERFAAAYVESTTLATPISLLLLDLDHFKMYNDAFGHAAGDEALRTLARLIGTVANRPGDAVCRIGGEEFAIVLAGTGVAGAATVAERIRETVARRALPHAPGAPFPVVTISVGFVTVEPAMLAVTTGARAFELADIALYRAKGDGRDRICRSAANANLVPLRAV